MRRSRRFLLGLGRLEMKRLMDASPVAPVIVVGDPPPVFVSPPPVPIIIDDPALTPVED